MAFLEATDAKKSFNWDDIDVGNRWLDHSQNFFAKKHTKDEQLDEIELFNAKLAAVALDDVDLIKTDDDFADDKENKFTEQQQQQQQTRAIKIEVESPELHESKTKIKCEKTEELSPKAPVKKPVVIACWSTQKPVVSKTIKPTNVCANIAAKLQPHTPKAYKYKDVYERKKKQMELQMQNEERKKREFHSHPVPNFSALHERLKKREVVYEFTESVTPVTLKRSKEAVHKKIELRKQLLAKEMEKTQKEKIHAHPVKVLHKEPFVPHKPHRPVVPTPFHLHSEKRLEERKLFDMEVQRTMEEKRKKEEEERKKAEEEQIRQLKKLTIFKARPNPFK